MGRRWIRGQTEARSGWILRLHTGGLITGATVGRVLPLFCPPLRQSRRGASAQCKQGGTAVTRLMRASLIESGRAAEMAGLRPATIICIYITKRPVEVVLFGDYAKFYQRCQADAPDDSQRSLVDSSASRTKGPRNNFFFLFLKMFPHLFFIFPPGLFCLGHDWEPVCPRIFL